MNFTRTDRVDGVVVLALEGRLNMVSTGRFREVIHEVVEGGGTRLAVDLSGVEFVDSSGLGALVSGLKTTRQAGGDLRIVGANDQVRLVLGLTNLERVLTPFATVEDAYAGS